MEKQYAIFSEVKSYICYMSNSFEVQKNIRAAIYTFAIAVLILLISFFWKWQLLDVIKLKEDEGILVELNIPEASIQPVETGESGGGGGGNPVETVGEKGTAYSPPQQGEKTPSKDIEEDPKETKTPAILKPDNPKPLAKKININTTPVKTTPKPVTATPAPTKPKAIMGKTVLGGGSGGGTNTDANRSGGSGSGSGVGQGSGSGGGSGSGSGGGNGTGAGVNSGPRITRGDRRIVQAYSFQGNLNRATIYADVKVSPEGTGTFIRFARGSTATGSNYKNAIVQYLQRMKFNTADHESTVTVQFNFRVTD